MTILIAFVLLGLSLSLSVSIKYKVQREYQMGPVWAMTTEKRLV